MIGTPFVLNDEIHMKKISALDGDKNN
jgi:hypothetical protein